MTMSNGTKSSSAAALLNVPKTYVASDVMNFACRDDSSKATTSGGETTSEGRPPVVVLDSKMTPLEAATVLWENNIMGAPVYDAESKSSPGMFDVRDILSCVTAAHREFVAAGGVASPGEDTHLPSDVVEVEANRKKQRDLMEKTLQYIRIHPPPGAVNQGNPTVSYLALRNRVDTTFHAETPLLDVCRALSDKGVHRVPIMDSSLSTPVFEGIISQSGLVRYIASMCPPDSLKEKMTDAGLSYKRDVVKVPDECSAADAFDLLDSKRLSGIAVVDEDGKLIGNTSARDIKYAVMDAGRTGMDMDILSYLAHVRQAEIVKNDRYPSCHVHEDSTVEHVVKLMAKTGYHRVFVVNEELEPIGLVSFTDIIKFMIERGE